MPVGENHPLSHDKAPITLGHEYCGEVVELGEGVDDIAIGDRVAVEPIFSCGQCAPCREGLYNLCEDLGFVGLSGGAGGFAAFSVVPARMAHNMPDALSMEQGALVEPAAVALHAVRVSTIKAGDTAAVFGAGPIGLMLVEALRAAGAGQIYVVEPSKERRAKAMELGATLPSEPFYLSAPIFIVHTSSWVELGCAGEHSGIRTRPQAALKPLPKACDTGHRRGYAQTRSALHLSPSNLHLHCI